jgi:hypothetical protein
MSIWREIKVRQNNLINPDDIISMVAPIFSPPFLIIWASFMFLGINSDATKNSTVRNCIL